MVYDYKSLWVSTRGYCSWSTSVCKQVAEDVHWEPSLPHFCRFACLSMRRFVQSINSLLLVLSPKHDASPESLLLADYYCSCVVIPIKEEVLAIAFIDTADVRRVQTFVNANKRSKSRPINFAQTWASTFQASYLGIAALKWTMFL